MQTSKQPLKISIVGCGKIADGHVEEIQKLPQARIVGVCDIDPLMAEQIGVRYGIEASRRYSDFDRMLESERPDVVHITTPPQSHPMLAAKAMNQGCHIYVEKPFALNHAASQEIVGHAIRTNRKVTINYWPNFDPPGLALRHLVESGILGDPVHVESFYGYNLAGEYGAALLEDTGHWVHKLPGKLFHNILDHIVNKITLFVPDQKPEIATMAYRRRPASGNAVIDSILDELRFVLRGQDVSAYGTFCSHAHPVGHFLRVYGTRNTIHVDYRIRTIALEVDQTIPSALGRLFPPFSQAWQYLRQGSHNVLQFTKSEFHYFAGMRRLILEFYKSIVEDGPPPIPYTEILRVAAIMDDIIGQVDRLQSVQAAGE